MDIGNQMQIAIDDDTAMGVYANMAAISHSESEFTFDFIYVQPGVPKGKVRARIISSPTHARKLLQALQDNLKIYEEKFGSIDRTDKKKIGF